MFARTHLAMRLAVLFGIALAMLAPRVEAAALQPEQDPAAQVVVLLPGRSLHERRLPALIQIQPGRYMLASTLERVCAKLMPRADSLLMFLPASRSCEMVDAQARVTLRQRLRQLTGRWLANGPQSRLREQSFVVVAPAPTLVNQSASCTCPNKPPNGVSMCTAQARTTGQPIGTVEYLASDPDGDALNGTFSYRYDLNPFQNGLPSPLTSSCTPMPGALQCTVNGNAPAQPGNLQLLLTVSDGISLSDLLLVSGLEVLDVSERVYASGFEDPANLTCNAFP